ncbi:MAG: hypothetical protein WD768_06965 [Phycisphaeraceae bacterium]
MMTPLAARCRHLRAWCFLFVAASGFAAPPAHAAPIAQEKDGLVIMEAEDTPSKLGDWVKKKDVKGFGGECHLEFTGNKPETGPAKSPLKYAFKVTQAGKYSLLIRAHKRLESERQDISNDCYVALEGDFTSGGAAPLEVLKKDTKLFGGDAKGWGWATTLDVDHKKYPAVYELKAGKTYILTLSGRSKNFNIDTIYFAHESLDAKKVMREQHKAE